MTQIELMRENADLRTIGEQDRKLVRMLNIKICELAEEKDQYRLALQRVMLLAEDETNEDIWSIARAALTAKELQEDSACAG